MKNLTKILFLCGVIVIMAFSCDKEKEEPQLPPATQTGANTFGCYINGELLIPKNADDIPQTKGLLAGMAEGYENPDFFYIDAGNRISDDGDLIYIYIPELSSPDEYFMGQVDINNNYVKCLTRLNSKIKTYYSFDKSGTINITRLDTTNTIVSGTFQLTVYNKDNPDDKIEITEGRFDINWTTVYH